VTSDTHDFRVLPAETATVLPGPATGLTVREVARRYRVGEDKVRGWIRSGELRAINTAATLCGKPRWVITPEALERFERGRMTTKPAKTTRRKRRIEAIDFYPD
jgi:excisionase family DNA binding protein